MISFRALLTSSLLAVTACLPAFADDQAKPLSREDVETIVKQVINDNPELILSSVQNYERKKQAEDSAKASQAVVALQPQIKNDHTSPYAGNPHGDVTIVEFFDYHCGYCKQFLPVVSKLLDEDKNLRIIFKEFPILSEDSGLAAKAALAVNSIDKSKYLAFHTALMHMSSSFTMENLTDKARAAGIDPVAFKKAMNDPAISKQITDNMDMAHSLNIHGTPAIIVGTEMVPGAVSASDLQAKIAAVRAEHK